MWYANEEGGVHFLLSAQPMFPQATISLAIELVPMNEERGQRHFGDSRVYRERCYFPVSELFYMRARSLMCSQEESVNRSTNIMVDSDIKYASRTITANCRFY